MKKRKSMKKRFAALAMAVILAWTTVDMPIVAAENPQCTCAEKCTEDTLNVWCDVCGVQGVNACQGEDTVVAYEIVASGTCGAEGNENSVTWSLDSDGTLTISGSGAMWDYYTGDKRAPWNVHKDNITTVIIEEGVTTIGTYAFWSCAQLTEITISATVTTIGDRAFFLCERLIQITIPQSVTSIGEGVFAGCSSLTSVTLPNSISTIQEDTFLNCKSLTSLTIPNGVTTIGAGAFYNCTSLNSITIPEGVTTIGDLAFSGCTSLETIVIPSSVTTIGANVFNEVPGVSSEDGFLIINGILLKYTGDAANVEIPSGVTKINQRAFEDNQSIVTVKIPSGVTTLGSNAFFNCDSLVSVELPETLISMESSFIYCDGLKEITIPNGMETIGSSAFYECISLEKVTIPNSVTEIGTNAFENIAANATINAPCSWNENPLYSFADGITVNIPAHQNLTYSVNDEGNVINNECSNCGKVGGTLTINAEGGIYDGTTKYGATVEKTGTLANKEVTVNYYQGVTLIGTDAPINAGTYTAKITYEDVTASVTFTITRAFEVTGGTEGVDYTYENGVLTINTSTALTIKNTDPSTPTTDRIEVATGISANITLAGVNIDVSATENTAAFKIADNSTGNVTITLADGTTNTLKSGKYCAGLQKNGGTSTGMLTIQGETAGTGVLNAIGADYGAGIGGDQNSSGCNITISGGIVTAQCDDEVGAGIGGGEWGSGRNITISGGTVTVQGGSDSAGIGGGILGYGSNIEISGGSVKVVAGYGAPAIGDGRAYGSAVTPTDGTNDVYLLELTVDGTSAVTINGSTNYPKKHFEENKLYVYLPAKTAQAPNEVTIGSTTTKYTYDTTNSKWLTVVDAPEADINKFICNGVELTYTLAESDYYTISGNKQTNAGTYTVTVSLKDKENTVWSDGTTEDKEYSFVINKADSVLETVPTPKIGLTYTGGEQNLLLAGTATGGEMQYSLDGTNYSSAIPTGTDAKTYTVWYKVVGDKNHNDTEPEKVEVTIAPKTLEISSVTAINRAFDGTNTVEISGVIISGILNTDNVSASATATINSMNAGDYTTVDLSNITLTGSAASNYSIAASVKDVPLTTAVTISKADAPTLPSGSKAYVYSIGYEGESVSITGLPTNCGEVEYSLLSVSSDMFENVSVDANGKITYDVKELDSYTDDLQGTISVNVVMKNYETAIYTLTITRTEKIPQNISAENITLTYGDADATISVTGAKTGLTYEVISDSNNNGDVITVDANGKVSIENAGTAIIKITAVASDTYAESECEIRVTINKRPVNIKAESYTVKKGDKRPVFEYNVTGLVNDDTLPITVSIACTALDTNTVGKYDITVSGVSSEGNYTYVYTNGVLEVLAEDEAPFIVGDDGKMGWDAISDEIADAETGDEVVVDMNGATVVPGDIIEEARDKGITITFEVDENVSWTIYGGTVTSGDIGNIDFGTTIESEDAPLNNIPVDVINNITGEKSAIEVNLAYSGDFGFTAVLTTNLSSANAGYYANLFYYNPTSKELEYVCADVIADDGTAELTFTHASDYLIVIDDVDLGNVKSENVPDTNASTGDVTPLMAFAFVLVVSGMGMVVMSRKKKEI